MKWLFFLMPKEKSLIRSWMHSGKLNGVRTRLVIFVFPRSWIYIKRHFIYIKQHVPLSYFYLKIIPYALLVHNVLGILGSCFKIQDAKLSVVYWVVLKLQTAFRIITCLLIYILFVKYYIILPCTLWNVIVHQSFVQVTDAWFHLQLNEMLEAKVKPYIQDIDNAVLPEPILLKPQNQEKVSLSLCFAWV